MTASSRLRKSPCCKLPKKSMELDMEQQLIRVPATQTPANPKVPNLSSPSPKSPKLAKDKDKELKDFDADDDDVAFEDHTRLTRRMAQRLYYGRKLPVNPRPSLPLTVLAVNAFTSGTFDSNANTLEFLDLDMASEVGRNACVSPTTLIMALVYLDRLSRNNCSYLKGGSVSPSELFVVALLVANKFTQDEGEDCGVFNDEWAASGRIDLTRLNKLEIEFLNAMDWNLKVDESEFMKYLEAVEWKLAQSQGASRGWFTYTELDSLTTTTNIGMQSKEAENFWNGTLEHFIKVTTATYIAYATFIATLITSTVLLPQFISLTSSYITEPTATTPAPGNWNLSSNAIPSRSFGLGYEFFQTDDNTEVEEDFILCSSTTAPNLEDRLRLSNKTNTLTRQGNYNYWFPILPNLDSTCQYEKTVNYNHKLGPKVGKAQMLELEDTIGKCWSELHEDLRSATNPKFGTFGTGRLKHTYTTHAAHF